MEKLTVIVPCYNVEKYIDNTIDCLLKQSYKNIELIFIDDCSTDSTYEHLRKIENQENIIILKNEKNSGAAVSRNKGIKYANSEYIGFMDPDDKIDYDYYEILMEELKESDADAVVTDILSVDEDNQENQYYSKCCMGEISKINLINVGIAASPCNKIIRKSLLIKYPFLEGKINEDVASIIPCLVKSKKVAYTNKTKYYYIQRKNSVQHKTITTKRFDIFDALKICLERIKDEEEFELYKETLLFHQIAMLYFFVLPTENSLLKRYILLKLFMKKQKKYNLYKNIYYEEFLEKANEEDKKYFGELISYLKNSNAYKANILIKNRKGERSILDKIKYKIKRVLCKIRDLVKKIIRKLTTKNVIKANITIKKIEKLAKKQSKKEDEKIKVSVVIPNYNYKNFLLQRLYSILYQTRKIYEIIILDDSSNDGSKELIEDIYNRINNYVKIKKVYNTQNTGSAFKQWQNGFNLTEGDYVWIAEADDFCSENLLDNLLKPIENNVEKAIYISYADTAFIDAKGNIFVKTIKPNIDLRNTRHWENDFIQLGNDEIKNYAFLNCTIANVSSCIIKKENYDDIFKKAGEYKQAGDWLFYVYVMNKGYISFTNKVLNYYRVHGNNITSKMKLEKHLEEIKKIHKEMENIILIEAWHKNEFEKRYNFLIEAWGLNKDNI